MESTSNFKHFEKKGWLSHLWYFRNYRLWKSWLDHSLKSTISEHALTVNMSKRPKYLRNLHESAFVKILTICHSQFKCNYLENEKLCLHFLFNFWNLHQILNVLKKRIIVIANVFLELQAVKILVRLLSKERFFRTHFDSQHVKASQVLAKYQWEHFYHVFSTFSGELIWKMSPLMLGKILGVFVNTMTADGKYPIQDCENLQLPIEMQLSKKRKTLSQFFVPFVESTSNFKHFERNDDHHS